MRGHPNSFVIGHKIYSFSIFPLDLHSWYNPFIYIWKIPYLVANHVAVSSMPYLLDTFLAGHRGGDRSIQATLIQPIPVRFLPLWLPSPLVTVVGLEVNVAVVGRFILVL
jgi:hypothetical protein